jgi:hypothetical protein
MQILWNKVKALAAFYAAAAGCLCKGILPFAREMDLVLAFTGKNSRCCNGEKLVEAVREILTGKSTVQLSCIIGTLEEFAEESRSMLKSLEGLPLDIWEDYRLRLLEGDLDHPEGGFRAIQELYGDYPETEPLRHQQIPLWWLQRSSSV